MENNKKQTAVEWLVEQLFKPCNNTTDAKKIDAKSIIGQAKEMEKEQHKETWEEGIDAGKDTEAGFPPTWIDFEYYYNETYKK